MIKKKYLLILLILFESIDIYFSTSNYELSGGNRLDYINP